MSQLPPFALPSNPTKKITLREATVLECIDFAGVDPSHEEEITTLFLNRLQDKATFIDSKIWTADDRRLGVFWYWIHTAKDTDVFTSYHCNFCNQTHSYLEDYKRIADSYLSITGVPARDVFLDAEHLVIRPLTGEDMEAMEMLWLELGLLKTGTGEYARKEAEIKVDRVCRAIGWITDELKARMQSLPITQYQEISKKVEAALDDMEHGLESIEVDGALRLLLPPHQCPNVTDREALTRLWVTFRCGDYLPKI